MTKFTNQTTSSLSKSFPIKNDSNIAPTQKVRGGGIIFQHYWWEFPQEHWERLKISSVDMQFIRLVDQATRLHVHSSLVSTAAFASALAAMEVALDADERRLEAPLLETTGVGRSPESVERGL